MQKLSATQTQKSFPFKDLTEEEKEKRDSHTFELEEHKLSEIIKSSEKHFEDQRKSGEFLSPSSKVKLDFLRKEPPRLKLQSNLYPESGEQSAKHLWSTKQENSMHIQNFLESYQNTHSRGALMQSGSSSQNEPTGLNSKLAQNIRRQVSRQTRKKAFGSALKHKSKGKLFSMRKKAKLSQQSSGRHFAVRQDSQLPKTRNGESHLLSASELDSQTKTTKFLIQRATLSKEDFSFPKQKIKNLFEVRKQKSSKKSFLEKKITLNTKFRNCTPSQIERQNSIFEETQAKFEQNISSTKAAHLLQKIVGKEKICLTGREKEKNQKIFKQRRGEKVKVERTLTREGVHLKKKTEEFSKKDRHSQNNSLNLSDSVGFGSKINKENKKKSNKKNRFYYKKSLQRRLYNQEVKVTKSQENKTYQSIYVYKDDAPNPLKKGVEHYSKQNQYSR